MTSKPKASNSESQRQLDQAEKQFEAHEQQVNALTLDRMNMAKKEDVEPQTKMSQKDIEKSKQVYLKPKKTIGCKEKFNEKFRDEYNYQKEYVQFIAENKEIIGETIDMWTRPFPGMPAEEWDVPTNSPVWGPRYLAEQIKRCTYHRLKSENSVTHGSDHLGTYHGSVVVDTIIQRLDAYPVAERKSVFMGAAGF